MSISRIAGFALLAVGLILLWFAYQASTAPLEEVSSALTGRFTSETMAYLIIGAAATIGGVFLAFFGARR